MEFQTEALQVQVGRQDGVYRLGGSQGKLPEGDTLELGGPPIKEETAVLAPKL